MNTDDKKQTIDLQQKKSTTNELNKDRIENNENMDSKETFEFYKNKCERLKKEIDLCRQKCLDKETENFELSTKIAEMREIIDASVEIKQNLEDMGIDVDELLDEIDEN